MKPGIYAGLSMREYLEIEALSATPARAALEECPQAGWFKSLLNEDRVREESEVMDRGTIAHAILLEGSTASVCVIDPKDYPSKTTGAIPKGWTNNDIRKARDDARAAGRHPILSDDFADVEGMVAVASAYIESLRHTEPAIWNAFQPDGGQSEVTCVWEESGQLCKLRADRASNDWTVTVDYKSSGASVEPDRWGRGTMVSMGYDFGAAWYARGIKKLTGIDTSFVFLCQEIDAPFLCSLIGMDPERMTVAQEKVQAALRIWARCTADGVWPGFPNRVCYPQLPPWERARWEEQQVAGIPYELGAMFDVKELNDWTREETARYLKTGERPDK